MKKLLLFTTSLLINNASYAIEKQEIVLESLQNNSTCVGITTIHGYAGSDVSNVVVYIDGNRLTNLPVGASRTDVQLDDSNGFGPGWGTIFNCGILVDGKHVLEVTNHKGFSSKKITFTSKKLGGDEFISNVIPAEITDIPVAFNNVDSKINLLWSTANQTYTIVPLDNPNIHKGLDAVNALRESGAFCGDVWYESVPPVRWNNLLSDAAKLLSDDLANNIPPEDFGHTGSDGSSAGERINRVGYSWKTFGENAAAAPVDLEASVVQFHNSPGHCANMMNENFKEFGDHLSFNSNSRWKNYVVQVFGTR